MGFLSSLFGPSTAAAHQFADVCVGVRDQIFQPCLKDYVANRFETPGSLMRLEFSKDVLLLLLAATALQTRIRNHDQLMRTNEAVRDRYLSRLPVQETTVVGDGVICTDELDSLAPFVAPNGPITQIRTTKVSTIGLLSLVVDLRAGEFRSDLATGIAQSKVGTDMWLPVARRMLSRIRGISPDSVPFDHTNHFSIAIMLPFAAINESAQRLF